MGNQYRSKYKNKFVRNSYGFFHSKGEFERYMYLRDLEKKGKIQNLQRQVKFQLTVFTVHICTYTADFTYERDGKPIVEDFKGYRTDIFNLKEKLMLACHRIKIHVVKSPTA